MSYLLVLDVLDQGPTGRLQVLLGLLWDFVVETNVGFRTFAGVLVGDT